MEKEEIIYEINITERINGYLKNYPIETVINLVNSDVENAKRKLEKVRKSEANKTYREGSYATRASKEFPHV